MARQRIVDLQKLHHLFREGKTVVEIAGEMGVTKGSISKNLKKLRHALTSDYPRVAMKVHNQSIINMNRLEKQAEIIDEQINNTLQEISVANNFTERDALRQTLIKLMAESRKQSSLKFNIERDIYKMIEAKAFQNDVIQKLKELSDEQREKFFGWLDTQVVDEGLEGDGGLRVSETD